MAMANVIKAVLFAMLLCIALAAGFPARQADGLQRGRRRNVASKLRRSLLSARVGDNDAEVMFFEEGAGSNGIFKKKSWKKAFSKKTWKKHGKALGKAAKSVAKLGGKLFKCLKNPIKCVVKSLTPKKLKRMQQRYKQKFAKLGFTQFYGSMMSVAQDVVAGVHCAEKSSFRVPTGIKKNFKLKYRRVHVCMKPKFKMSKMGKARSSTLLKNFASSKLAANLLSHNKHGRSFLETRAGANATVDLSGKTKHRCNPKKMGAVSLWLGGDLRVSTPKLIGIGVSVGVELIVGCEPIRGFDERNKWVVLNKKEGNIRSTLRWVLEPDVNVDRKGKSEPFEITQSMAISWLKSWPNNPEFEMSFYMGGDDGVQVSTQISPFFSLKGFKKPKFQGVSLEVGATWMKQKFSKKKGSKAMVDYIAKSNGKLFKTMKSLKTFSLLESNASSTAQAEAAAHASFVQQFIENDGEEWVHEDDVAGEFEDPTAWNDVANAADGELTDVDDGASANEEDFDGFDRSMGEEDESFGNFVGDEAPGNDGEFDKAEGAEFLEVSSGSGSALSVGDLGVGFVFSGDIVSRHGFFSCYTPDFNQEPKEGC